MTFYNLERSSLLNFHLFIHSLHLEQGEDTQVENFLELNVEKQSAPWGQIYQIKRFSIIRGSQ